MLRRAHIGRTKLLYRTAITTCGQLPVRVQQTLLATSLPFHLQQMEASLISYSLSLLPAVGELQTRWHQANLVISLLR